MLISSYIAFKTALIDYHIHLGDDLSIDMSLLYEIFRQGTDLIHVKIAIYTLRDDDVIDEWLCRRLVPPSRESQYSGPFSRLERFDMEARLCRIHAVYHRCDAKARHIFPGWHIKRIREDLRRAEKNTRRRRMSIMQGSMSTRKVRF